MKAVLNLYTNRKCKCDSGIFQIGYLSYNGITIEAPGMRISAFVKSEEQ